MEKAQILLALNENLPNAVLRSEDTHDGMMTFAVDATQVYNVLLFLKEHTEFQFNFLTDLCGAHFPKQEGQEIAVIYHLHAWIQNARLRIKTYLPEENPSIQSVCAIWPAANWMERETYDFYGVQFKGHPNLKRILNVDEMEVFPMRKEFALEDGTRTDKVDSFFGRKGNEEQTFD